MVRSFADSPFHLVRDEKDFNHIGQRSVDPFNMILTTPRLPNLTLLLLQNISH